MKQTERRWTLALLPLELLVFGGIAIEWFGWNNIVRAFDEVCSYSSRPVESSPEVLVVSARESDRFSVRQTVEPRGYTVLFADNVAAGMAILGRQPNQIAILVIDTELARSNRLLQAARSCCRRTHVVALSGPRQAGQVSSLLINTAID